MNKHESTSVDSVQKDVVDVRGENIQTNAVLSDTVIVAADVTPERIVASPSTILGNDDGLYKEEDSQSVNSVDTQISQKYSITLEQARDRALKAVKRARERKPLVLDEDD